MNKLTQFITIAFIVSNVYGNTVHLLVNWHLTPFGQAQQVL